jgi:hypothetical protein
MKLHVIKTSDLQNFIIEKHREILNDMGAFEKNGAIHSANVYYNIIYDLYRDFRIIGVIIGGILLGYFVYKTYLMLIFSQNITNYIYFGLFNVGLGVLSINASWLTGRFWNILIIFMALSHFSISK